MSFRPDIHDVSADRFYFQRADFEDVSKRITELVQKLRSKEIPGDFRQQARDLLEEHAGAMGTPELAKVRLRVYEALDNLEPGKLADALEAFNTYAREVFERLIQAEQENIELLNSMSTK